MNKILDYIINRGKEASTWRGIIAIAMAVGLKISPEIQEAILAFGLAAIGLIGTLFGDKPKEQ